MDSLVMIQAIYLLYILMKHQQIAHRYPILLQVTQALKKTLKHSILVDQQTSIVMRSILFGIGVIVLPVTGLGHLRLVKL
jgi:hypothetical protein